MDSVYDWTALVMECVRDGLCPRLTVSSMDWGPRWIGFGAVGCGVVALAVGWSVVWPVLTELCRGLDSEREDSKQQDSKQTDSKQTDSKQTDSKQTDS